VRDAVEWLLDQHGMRETAVRAFLDSREGFSVGAPGTGGAPGGDGR
jgi:hypothetical protein